MKRPATCDIRFRLQAQLALVTTLHSSFPPSAVNLRERIVLEAQLRPRL